MNLVSHTVVGHLLMYGILFSNKAEASVPVPVPVPVCKVLVHSSRAQHFIFISPLKTDSAKVFVDGDFLVCTVLMPIADFEFLKALYYHLGAKSEI